MRWRIVATTNGAFVLFLDGQVLAASDDLNLVISFYGEITRQNIHAIAS